MAQMTTAERLDRVEETLERIETQMASSTEGRLAIMCAAIAELGEVHFAVSGAGPRRPNLGRIMAVCRAALPLADKPGSPVFDRGEQVGVEMRAGAGAL
jgi:hypothetical protein